MFLSILTFLTALSISIVAIYYSVAGLVAIFAAAAIPVMIMGTTLEIAKLVTAVWLHKYWSQTVWWLKTYLSIAVVLLMLITSMGIFGFLSKAHIEQTATANENVALIEQLSTQITRDEEIIAQAESEIESISAQGVTQDTQIQEQIDKEQERIDSAYARIQPAIDEQNTIISKFDGQNQLRIDSLRQEIAAIDENLARLQEALTNNEVRVAQSIVGVQQDGSLGPGTERAIQAYRDQQRSLKVDLEGQISQIGSLTDPAVDAARSEIQRLRSLAETEIADSNQLISRLRLQLGTVDRDQQQVDITEQQQTIQSAQARIEENTSKKFELEADYRKLEAEVGPVKYLAEFVYGTSADKNMLEEAVKWVIVLIIFVFDPLAVLLLIASQYSFGIHRKLAESLKDNSHTLVEPASNVIDVARVTETVNDVPETKAEEVPVADTINNTEYDLEDRIADLLEKESDEKWKLAKIRWKIDNPRANTKTLRQQYLEGKIDKLPWEEYMASANYVQNSEQDQSSLFTKIQQTKNE